MNTNILFFAAFAIIIILIIICFILNMVNASKINTVLDYTEGHDGDLITSLKDYYNKVEDLSKTITDSSDAALLSRLTECEKQSSLSFKKSGIVNFNAFDDVTGNQSFSVAILNNTNEGFILTSLFGHNSCNTYIRSVIGGEATIKLLDEEREALEKAKASVSEL